MSNFKWLLTTFVLSVGLIIVVSFYKVQAAHKKTILLVSSKRIEEGARACFQEDKCFGSHVTLGELIHLGYAKEEVNPITKMYYSHASYVEKKENTYTFVEVDS